MSVCKHGYTSVFGAHRIICPFCEIDRLRKELVEAKEESKRDQYNAAKSQEESVMLLNRAEAAERELKVAGSLWQSANDCMRKERDEALAKLAVCEGALKDIIKHQKLMAGPWLSKHSVVIFLAQRALDKIKGVDSE